MPVANQAKPAAFGIERAEANDGRWRVKSPADSESSELLVEIASQIGMHLLDPLVNLLELHGVHVRSLVAHSPIASCKKSDTMQP